MAGRLARPAVKQRHNLTEHDFSKGARGTRHKAVVPPLLARVRKLCLSLSETSEVAAWGHPNFRVHGKTFAVYEFYKGRPNIAVKTEPGLQGILVDDEKFFRTPYIGQHGWVSVWVDQPVDWKLVRDLILASYRLVAPGRPARKPAAKAARPARDRGKTRRRGGKRA